MREVPLLRQGRAQVWRDRQYCGSDRPPPAGAAFCAAQIACRAALDLSRDRLLALLALVVAGAVDLSREDTSAADLRKQAIAERLSQQLDLDMRGSGRLTWNSAAAVQGNVRRGIRRITRNGRSQRGSRADLIEVHTKLRRDEIAQKVAKVFEGTAYLPDILVNPVAAGGLALTPAGVESLAHASVAANSGSASRGSPRVRLAALPRLPRNCPHMLRIRGLGQQTRR